MSDLSDHPVSHLANDAQREAFIAVFSPQYAKRFDDGIAWVKVSFMTPSPKKFFQRGFAFLSRNLYAETIYRRSYDFDQAKLEKFSKLCLEKSTAVLAMISKNLERIEQLSKDNGVVVEDMSYLRAFEREAPVIHPVANIYLNILRKLDRLFIYSGAAYLAGVFTADQKRQAELTARKAVTAFEGMVRSESGRLKNEAEAALLRASTSGAAHASTGMDDESASTDDLRDAIKAQDAGNQHYDGDGPAHQSSTEDHLAEMAAMGIGKEKTSKPRTTAATSSAVAT